jgi:CHAT domain-containing protein
MKITGLSIFLFFISFFSLAQDTWERVYAHADSLMMRRDFKNAIPLYENALNLAEKKYGISSKEYLNTRNGLGRSVSFVGEKKEAEQFLYENHRICKIFGEKTPQFAWSMQNLGAFYLANLSESNTEKAAFFLKKATALRKEILGEKHPDYALSLNTLAILHYYLGNYELAEPLYLETIKIQKEVLGEKNASYAASLNNLSSLYQNSGNYAAAEQFGKEALKIRKEIYGEKNSDYASSVNNLAILNVSIGNYGVAEQLYKECLAIRKEILGENNPDYISAMNNLAVLYQGTERYTDAESLYNDCIARQKEISGEKNPTYARFLSNLANLYSYMGNYAAAKKHYTESLNIRREILGEKHTEYAASLNNLANLYQEIREFDTAEALFKQSMNIRREAWNEKHPEYITSVNNLANCYDLLNRKKEAAALKKEVKNWCIGQINIQFPLMSEVQRENFYDKNLRSYLDQYNSFSVNLPQINTVELFDLQLSVKAVLMQASKKMKSRILQSQDSVLIKKYKEWSNLKEKIIKAEDMNDNTRSENGIKLDSLVQANEELEKDLSKKSEAFAALTDKKQYSWKDIQKTLKSGEAAVEIVRISHFGVKRMIVDTSDVEKAPHFPSYALYDFTDSIIYLALIVKKDSKQPEAVLLRNGKDLENKYVFYQKNAVLYHCTDSISYDMFWKPIAEKLKNVKKVYFSPDGIYNQISLNTLRHPKTKKFVLEETELHIVTTCKDLLFFGKKENKNLYAELLGFPAYDLKTEIADKNTKKNNSYLIDFQNITPLPGTQKEVESIAELLKKHAYQLKVLTEREASEENVKLSKNPKILHLSTHGFFIEKRQKSTKSNPMLRSGLLFAGVRDYARALVKPDREDGILTALEAANLDLDETDLVILSACETGLGDLKAGEGVFGLQRAFKVAGAKSIVMSLWSVNDAVTQKLMTAFYQNLLTVHNARKAFLDAQAEIKKQYPEPYFWGAFVMVGE